MTYAEAIKFLYDLRWFGAKFGLENTRQLAALAGNPQDQLRFIHVAGTNGKGSTCAMLESIYRAAGLRVGLFTSPHLVSFRERIQLDRQLISQAEVVRLVEDFQPWLSQFPAEHHPTFFEVVTVLALRYFAKKKCDLVIWETGLGGRLDATNIVTPLASVITNIGLDHQQWLGDTLEQIAMEKGGIIKPGVPALTTADAPEALRVIEQLARKNRAPFLAIGGDAATRCPRLALPGAHQQTNAALTLATVATLQNQIPVTNEQIRTGLAQVNWPGRLQLITRPNGQRVLLDGAHNPDGVDTLVAALGSLFPGEPPAIVLGVFQDKDWRGICARLVPLARRVIAVPVGSERTVEVQALASACRELRPDVPVTVCDSLPHALEVIAGDPFAVVTGSLYLVGEALQLLDPKFRTAGDERALNEWGATRHDAVKP